MQAAGRAEAGSVAPPRGEERAYTGAGPEHAQPGRGARHFHRRGGHVAAPQRWPPVRPQRTVQEADIHGGTDPEYVGDGVGRRGGARRTGIAGAALAGAERECGEGRLLRTTWGGRAESERRRYRR